MAGPKPGTAWRGRMLSRTITESKKLAGVSERAALIYLLLLPKHDGEGMIEADDVSMLVGCGRFALAHSWTVEDMAAVRAELFGPLLWDLVDGPHGLAAQYVGWENHQRLEKIGRGSAIAADSGASSPISGTTMAGLRHNSGLEEKGSEEKGKMKRKATDTTILPDLISINGGEPTDHYSFGLRSWRLHRDQIGKDEYLPPAFEPEFRRHAAAGTFSTFATPEILAARFTAVWNELGKARDKDGKPYGRSPRALLNGLRRDEDDDQAPARTASDAPGQPAYQPLAEGTPWLAEARAHEEARQAAGVARENRSSPDEPRSAGPLAVVVANVLQPGAPD